MDESDDLEYLPRVTVQLPLYNERYVAKRLIDTVSQLDYPKELLEIQVLDDSDDDTYDLVAEKVRFYKKKGLQIDHITRSDRQGFKAGALQNGLEIANGELMAIFDADFMPKRSFLKDTVSHFKNVKVGLVQTRWGHINDKYSLLTKLQAFGLDAHFTVEQTGRSHAKSFINFNGTAGIWRKTCIVDAGGWSADTLTEDLDLSYRAQLKGWEFKYLEDVESPAELPILMSAVKGQQYRWNKGAAETAVKNLGKVIKMPPPFGLTRKLHAVLHLLNSSVFIPLLVAAVLSIPALFLKQSHPEWIGLFYAGSIFLAGFLSIGFFYWVSTKRLHGKSSGRYFIKHFPLFLSMSMGLSLHNSIAVIEGLIGHKTSFIRTPKFNVVKSLDSWKNNVYINSKISWSTLAEGLLGLYFLFGIYYGISVGDFGLIVFHLFLSFGFLAVCLYSLLPLGNTKA